MQAPFRIRSNVARVVAPNGFQYPLGIEAGGWRPRAIGWSRELVPADERGPETHFHIVAVSHERVRPLIRELMTLMPPRVSAALELGSRDAYREVDVYIGDWIERDRFLGAWQCVEPILLEDASIGVGVSGGRRGFEVFLDPDKRILIYASPEMAPKVEQLLRRFRLKRCSEDAVRGGPARSELRVRPVLEERPGMLSTVDHLLLELRADWALELDDDPDHNLDSRGRDIGFTLWHGLVFVDQEDPAGRRFGHAHVWGVATSRREMQGIIEARIARDYELSLYLQQRIELLNEYICSLFENDKVKKFTLDQFM